LFSLKYSARETITGQEKRQIICRAGKSAGQIMAVPAYTPTKRRLRHFAVLRLLGLLPIFVTILRATFKALLSMLETHLIKSTLGRLV